MTLAIVVEGDPRADASLTRALAFAKAAVATGRRIHRVFLYHDAVRIADPAFTDCEALIAEWIALAREHAFEITACVSAAERRGLNTDPGRARQGIAIAGLGQYADCLLGAERTVVFRA